jgi:POT family proton-dependent oligopeptide transporter
LGLVIMALGFGFLAAASAQYAQEGSSAMYWVILAFLFHTVGELCASPVSLSYITKLAPLKYASIIMGLYWAATGLGNKVAGKIGELSQSLGEFEIFLGIAIVWSVIGLLVIAMLKPLKRLSHGAEDGEIAM